MKYRIKEIVDSTGDSHYYPQIKSWFGWITLPSNSTSSIAYAKCALDKYELDRMKSKIKKVNYIDYEPNISLQSRRSQTMAGQN